MTQSPYQPSLKDFCNILRRYSEHGLRYFNSLSTEDTDSIRRSIGNGNIEDNAQAIETKFIATSKNREQKFKFFPMPKPGGNDFKVAFFSPRFRLIPPSGYMCSFVVVFWIDKEGGKTLAVRIEEPMTFDPKANSSTSGVKKGDGHQYTHFQFTLNSKDPLFETDLCRWVPTSYPAIPLGYSHPIQLFVGMAVAVHGYSSNTEDEYVMKEIRDAMAAASSMSLAQCIFTELQRTFKESPK